MLQFLPEPIRKTIVRRINILQLQQMQSIIIQNKLHNKPKAIKSLMDFLADHNAFPDDRVQWLPDRSQFCLSSKKGARETLYL